MTKTNLRKISLAGAVSLLALSLAAGNAYAQQTEFDIDAQPLAKALLDFNEQSGLTVAAPRTLVEDKFAPAVRGDMEPEEALEQILSGSGLKSTELSTGAYTITLASVEVTDEAPASFRLAQLDQEETRTVETIRDDAEEDERRVEDTIVVTGTNIRGVENSASPVFVFDADDIRRTGAATTQEFIRTLPQNLDFSESGAGSLAGATPGFGGASAGVNIRGLGASATLTLVNGRRLAASGSTGDFVDISLIPLSAIERVEVLTDGASSIYGSDAVAGVVNFILRDDYDGAETRIQIGGATQGSPTQFRASQILGKAWSGGNVLASYEYYRRNNLNANDRSFSEGALDPTDLLPNQQRHSIFLSGRQRVTDGLEIFGTGNFSTNDSNINQSAVSFGFVSESANNKQYGLTMGSELEISGDWNLEIAGGYNRSETDSVRLANGAPSFEIDAAFDLLIVDLIADGSLFELPGGNVRLAIGGQFRAENYRRVTTTALAPADMLVLDRDVYAVFGELFLPIVGRGNRRPGVYALDITAAGRFENFSDFGSSVNPKVGIRYAATKGLSLRGTYGTSFQAPHFIDLGLANSVVALPGFFFPPLPDPTGPQSVLTFGGGNLDLQPETSRNWTTGVDYAPSFAPGLEFAITYFDIEFKDRIGTPGSSVSALLNSPDVFGESLTFNPDASVVADHFSDPLIINPFGVLPGDIGVIADLRLQNLALTEVRGLDVAVSYNAETSLGNLAFDFNGSYMFDFVDQVTPAAASIQKLNTVGNPVDWRFRTSAGWSRKGYGAIVYVNYVDGYVNTETGIDAPVDSWTTVDLNLSYDPSLNATTSWLRDTKISFNVQNLFNEAPPFVETALGVGVDFDGANANALGRFVSLSITKAW